MEMLEEVMPKVLGTAGGSRQVSVELGSSREPATKRPASPSPDELRASESHAGPSPHNAEASEVLFCQDTMDALRQECPAATEFEVLLAGFLQKRLQKEIRSAGNEPLLQAKVDTAQGEEWETMLSKAAARVHKGAEAQRIRDKYPDRFVGSRFVVTNKVDEDGERVKARWCLQGHLDPDCHVQGVFWHVSFAHHVTVGSFLALANPGLKALEDVSRTHKRSFSRSRPP